MLRNMSVSGTFVELRVVESCLKTDKKVLKLFGWPKTKSRIDKIQKRIQRQRHTHTYIHSYGCLYVTSSRRYLTTWSHTIGDTSRDILGWKIFVGCFCGSQLPGAKKVCSLSMSRTTIGCTSTSSASGVLVHCRLASSPFLPLLHCYIPHSFATVGGKMNLYMSSEKKVE